MVRLNHGRINKYLMPTLQVRGVYCIKLADMTGLDWQAWQGHNIIGKCWQRTGIPKLAGTVLISAEKGAQAALPYAGRTAKTVASGRLIIKGLTMFAPLEGNLDKWLEHSGFFTENSIKGMLWGAAGLMVGYGAYSLLNGMKRYGREMAHRSRFTPSPQAPNLQKALVLRKAPLLK